MAFSAGSSSRVSAEINVTPLIDVLLVLVIVFMVIAPVASKGLTSQVPKGDAAAASGRPIIIEIVGGNGTSPRYRMDATAVAYADIQPQLAALLSGRRERTVYLQADRKLSYRVVAEVAGLAHAAGAQSVVLGDTNSR